ncbi:MAG: PAS domain-containing protein [Bryobacteraceae bacterium]
MPEQMLEDAVLRRLQESCLNVPIGAELMQILSAGFAAPEALAEEQVEPLIRRVKTPSYSVSDLFCDLRTVEQCFAAASGIESAEKMLRTRLDEIFRTVLRYTADTYEHMVERGWLPLCEVTCDGYIAYANSAMLAWIGSESVVGTKLSDYIAEDEKALVMEAVSAVQRRVVTSHEVRVMGADGRTRRASVRIQPLEVAGCRVGAYVTFFDLAEVVAQEEKFLDRLALAAIKLDRDFCVTYANPATMTLLGRQEEIRGLSIYKIFPRAEMSAHLDKRLEGQGELYETEIERPSDGKTIPVSVAGTPIIDSDGACIGSLGIVRSMEREKIAEAIHHLMQTESDPETLLTGVAKLVKRMVEFDYFGVTRFSLESDHVSLWFALTRRGEWDMTGSGGRYRRNKRRISTGRGSSGNTIRTFGGHSEGARTAPASRNSWSKVIRRRFAFLYGVKAA